MKVRRNTCLQVVCPNYSCGQAKSSNLETDCVEGVLWDLGPTTLYTPIDDFRCFGHLDFPTPYVRGIWLQQHSIIGRSFWKFISKVLMMYRIYSRFLMIKFRPWENVGPLSIEIPPFHYIALVQPIITDLCYQMVYICTRYDIWADWMVGATVK
jgi:hypothetical protein